MNLETAVIGAEEKADRAVQCGFFFLDICPDLPSENAIKGNAEYNSTYMHRQNLYGGPPPTPVADVQQDGQANRQDKPEINIRQSVAQQTEEGRAVWLRLGVEIDSASVFPISAYSPESCYHCPKCPTTRSLPLRYACVCLCVLSIYLCFLYSFICLSICQLS